MVFLITPLPRRLGVGQTRPRVHRQRQVCLVVTLVGIAPLFSCLVPSPVPRVVIVPPSERHIEGSDAISAQVPLVRPRRVSRIAVSMLAPVRRVVRVPHVRREIAEQLLVPVRRGRSASVESSLLYSASSFSSVCDICCRQLVVRHGGTMPSRVVACWLVAVCSAVCWCTTLGGRLAWLASLVYGPPMAGQVSRFVPLPDGGSCQSWHGHSPKVACT